jgi:hypothetical protein
MGGKMSQPNGTYAPASITFVDAGNEKSDFKVYGTPLTATNLVAKSADWDTLRGAADALVQGEIVKYTYNGETLITYGQPTNGAAREYKLLIQYRDTTTNKQYTTTLPTLNPVAVEYVINKNARDVVLLTSPVPVVDFIDAFEGFVVPPDAPTHAVQVVGLKAVGRSN